jgi:hypothetical protein
VREAGARSPDAPTEPCFGHNRRDAPIEQSEQRFDERRTTPEKKRAPAIGPAARHGAHHRHRQRVAETTRVTADEIGLQRIDLGRRDGVRANGPKPVLMP